MASPQASSASIGGGIRHRSFRPYALQLSCFLGLALLGCSTLPHGTHCPRQAAAGPLLPGATVDHQLADYWLRDPKTDQSLLLSAEQIATHNRALEAPAGAELHSGKRVDLFASELQFHSAELTRQLQQLEAAIEAGKRVDRFGKAPWALLRTLHRSYAVIEPLPRSFHTIQREAPLRCYPSAEGLYERPDELAFDLAQCAQLRFGELVRAFARSGSYVYVRASYAAGWVEQRALSAPIASGPARHYATSASFGVVVVDRLGIWSAASGGQLLGVARLGARLPLGSPATTGGALSLALFGPRGPQQGWVRTRERHGLSLGYQRLSRRSFLRRAFPLLHSPYGWGGLGANRDCSRLLMDLFASFGLLLPRNSTHQAQAGTASLEVGALADDDKAKAIEGAAARGLVLLYMPGHVMLYLGREGGMLFGYHLFSGYLMPCAEGGETMQRINRTAVTSLELGRGTSRRSFLQRITRLVLIGPPALKHPAGATPRTDA